jgi:hypothetical protein
MIRRLLRRAIENAPTDGEREYEMDPEELDDGEAE